MSESEISMENEIDLGVQRSTGRTLISKLWCIYKVEQNLKDVHEESTFHPKLVSIGPYHNNKSEHLKLMEQHKWRLLSDYLKSMKHTRTGAITHRMDEDMPNKRQRLVAAMKNLEHKARACYSEMTEKYDDFGSNEFRMMMLLDGCFIIQLLLLFQKSGHSCRNADDQMFTWRSTLAYLRHDLLLLENQLPFFVLRKLFKMSGIDKEVYKLTDLILDFFNPVLYRKKMVLDDCKKQLVSSNDKAHLLELFMSSFHQTTKPVYQKDPEDDELHFHEDDNYFPEDIPYDAQVQEQEDSHHAIEVQEDDYHAIEVLQEDDQHVDEVETGGRVEMELRQLVDEVKTSYFPGIIPNDTREGIPNDTHQSSTLWTSYFPGIIPNDTREGIPNDTHQSSTITTSYFPGYIPNDTREGIPNDTHRSPTLWWPDFPDIHHICATSCFPKKNRCAITSYFPGNIPNDTREGIPNDIHRFPTLWWPHRPEDDIPEDTNEGGILNYTGYHAQDITIHCVTELREAGIEFKKSDHGNLLHIEFKEGKLHIPTLFIDDNTVPVLLNFIAYEQRHNSIKPYFTSYLMFLDYLVNSSKDVEHLHYKGIINHGLGSDEEVATLFNKLCKEVVQDLGDDNYLSKLFAEVNQHFGKRWNRSRAAWKHEYFRTPWAFSSFLAAVVLVVLTFLQTFYTMYAYVYPPS